MYQSAVRSVALSGYELRITWVDRWEKELTVSKEYTYIRCIRQATGVYKGNQPLVST